MLLQPAVQTPRFETRPPTVVNSGGTLTITLPLLNTGTSAAGRVTITRVTLGSASRVEPALPLVIGDLSADGVRTIAPAFSASGLTVGSRLLITVQGTYRVGASTVGFTVTRPIDVPAPGSPAVARLAARVTVAVDATTGTWSYTIFNDEPSGSARQLNTFALDMVAPFTVVSTPPGWLVETDGRTSVLWYAADVQPPFPNHTPPQGSLSGFQIRTQAAPRTSEGRAWTITSWNRQTNQADRIAGGTTLVPARP